MKYYAAIIRVSANKEKAVVVKAPNQYDAEKLIAGWRGTLMNIAEVIVNTDYLKSLKREELE